MAIQTYSHVNLIGYMMKIYLSWWYHIIWSALPIPHQETNITYTYLYRYLCTCRADHLLLPPWINNQHSSVKRIIITYLSFFRQSLLNFYFYNTSNRWSVQALSVISFTFFYRKSLSWRHFFPMLKIALHNFEP